MHAAPVLFFCKHGALDILQVACLHLKSWTSLPASFAFCSIFFLVSERSGRQKPQTERIALCCIDSLHGQHFSMMGEWTVVLLPQLLPQLSPFACTTLYRVRVLHLPRSF